MKIGIVGAGRAGTAVAVLWQRAGHRIVAASGRGPTRDRIARFLPDVPLVEPTEVARVAEITVIAVPDDLIADVTDLMASEGGFAPGAWVAHLSGATPLGAMDAAGRAGARRLGIHPLQTFPDPSAGLERIPGCVIAVAADDEEGFFLAERLAQDLMGEPFRLSDDDRGLYHAAAVFASNYVVTASAVAEQLLSAAGVPDPAGAMRSLQEATVSNIASMGPAAALTGPAVRGDAGTVQRNLEAIATELPYVVPAYVEMARLALSLAHEAGRLDADRVSDVEEVLARWS